MVDRVGQRLGNYHLLRLLGRGGFAEVYLGEQVYLKKQYAIKVLSVQLADENMESFLTEAQTIALLEHRNIVQIHDFDVERESNTPYLVMSYAPNGTLRQSVPPGATLPLPMIVFYVKQIADALQYAHDAKIIHRDIKPENMLLGRQNEVLLSDFGIAVVAHSTRSQKMEAAFGTVDYMAPEQIMEKPLPASDQYALGIVVYEWLCGFRPFQGTPLELYGKHLHVPPPPMREKVPTIPIAVEQVVMTTLSKDPQQRFAKVQAFAIALEQAALTAQHSSFSLPGQPSPHPPVTPGLGQLLSLPSQTPWTQSGNTSAPLSRWAQPTIAASQPNQWVRSTTGTPPPQSRWAPPTAAPSPRSQPPQPIDTPSAVAPPLSQQQQTPIAPLQSQVVVKQSRIPGEQPSPMSSQPLPPLTTPDVAMSPQDWGSRSSQEQVEEKLRGATIGAAKTVSPAQQWYKLGRRDILALALTAGLYLLVEGLVLLFISWLQVIVVFTWPCVLGIVSVMVSKRQGFSGLIPAFISGLVGGIIYFILETTISSLSGLNVQPSGIAALALSLLVYGFLSFAGAAIYIGIKKLGDRLLKQV